MGARIPEKAPPMKCVICKHGETSPGKGTVILEREGATLIFKGVPAEVCENCGEKYFDETTTERLLKIAEDAARSGVEASGGGDATASGAGGDPMAGDAGAQYAQQAAARLDQAVPSSAPVMLAPRLYAIVERMGQLTSQLSDRGVREMTQTTPTASPAPSPSPSPTGR